MKTQAVQTNNYHPQFGMSTRVTGNPENKLYQLVSKYAKEMNADPATSGIHAHLQVTNTSVFASGTKHEGTKGTWWGWLLGKYKDLSIPTLTTGSSFKGEGVTTKGLIVDTVRGVEKSPEEVQKILLAAKKEQEEAAAKALK